MQNQFDCIDMSGNNIIRLEGFPKLPRLKMLLCCSNRISTFAPGLDRAPFFKVSCAVLKGTLSSAQTRPGSHLTLVLTSCFCTRNHHALMTLARSAVALLTAVLGNQSI